MIKYWYYWDLEHNRERLLSTGAMATLNSAVSFISNEKECLDDNSLLGSSVINLKVIFIKNEHDAPLDFNELTFA